MRYSGHDRLTGEKVVAAVRITNNHEPYSPADWAFASYGGDCNSNGDCMAAGAPAKADAAACVTDRQTLELAVDTYEALNGVPPADQAVLVTDQLITEPSPRFDVTDGVIAPAAGSPCT